MRNINKHNKTLTLKLKTYFSMVLLICAAVCGMFLVNGNAFASTSQPEVKVFDEGIKYFTTYGIGETIFIKKINVQINGEDVDVFAYLQKDNEIIEKLTPNNNMVCHVFEEKGKYQLVYFTKNDDLSQETIKKYSFTVNSQPYFKVEFAPSYVVGSVINVDGKCFYDLQSVNSAVTVTSPSGKVENVSGSFCANEIGFYEVEYSAQIAGINFSRKYTLDVTQKPASYTEYFHSVKGVSEIRADVSAPAYAKPGSGVAIYSNAQQCVFQYGNIIDLNTLTKNDQLISLLPLAGDGISPMDNFKVRLIDIYDSSNIIEYYVFSDYNPSLYDKEWTYASIIYKGKNYGIRRDGTFIKGRFGVDMSVHLRADLLEKEHMNGYGYGKAEWFCAQTDYLNKCFHVNAGFKYNVVKSHLLMDLSKSEYVGFGNEWSGFTTGEVYLQVEMNSSYGTCGMIVSEIAGESMSGELSDGRMPAGFFLDSEEDSQIPNAKVGLEYRVPEVSYYRDSLEGKVDNPEYSAKLYQIFLAPILMEEIPLTSGSSSKYSFIPTKTGNYKIVYSVIDKAGNTFSKEYKFTVEPNKTPNVQVDLPENLYVGEYLTIPQIKLLNMSRLTYKKTQIIYDGVDYSERIGDVILLNKVGEIKIRCLYEDYLGQELKLEKIYAVTEKDEPIISIVDNVPKYVLKGQSIVLPDFSAVTYKNGTAEQNISERKITVDGQEVNLTDRKIQVTKAHNEIIKVVYSALNAMQEYEIRVIDAKYLSDRFYAARGKFTSVENNKAYVKLSFDDDVCIDFINAAYIQPNSEFGFKFSLSDFNFDYIDIIFTDYKSSDKMLFIRLTEERGKLYAQLNAKGSKVILTSISENGKDYEISYSSVFGAFSPLFTIDEYFNGYKFDFFPSNLVYLTFDIVGVSSPSEISFSEIGGNKLVSFYNSNGEVEIYEDYGTPTIVREKSIHDLTLTYGSVVSVPKISALSIFSGFTWAEITVVSPSGKVLLSKANAYNDNDIVLEEYGAYTITYEMGYLLSSSQQVTEVFNVRKDASAEISFKDSVSSTVKTGDKIRIPELNVTGMEEDFVTNIYLIAPDFTMNEVETGEKISFTKQGIYKLVVIVSDEFNTCSKVFKVVVEG